MKTKFRIRLILSSLMLGLTAVTLTTSTFAWFATNRNAWFDEIELEIGNVDSLLVSVDGSSFRTSIPNDMLKRAVVAKKKGLDYNNSQLDVDGYVDSEWAKVSLEPITTNDLELYQCVDNKHVGTRTNSKNEEEKYYILHEVDESTSYSYIDFDVWFMMEASKSATKTYDLKLVTDEYITNEANSGNQVTGSYLTCDDSSIELYNELNTTTKLYEAGDYLSVNAKNAMRVGIKRLEHKGTVDDTENFIFEPYDSLGSYALKDYFDTADENYYKYDPNKNAMFTYFNSINEAKLDPLEAGTYDYTKNYKGALKDDVSLGVIQPNDTGKAYTLVKLTISVWLEGYDADYIIGMKNNSLKMYLNFFAEEKE